MSVLKMETDEVRALANQLRYMSENLRNQGHSLRNTAQASDWHGPNRDEFIRELDQILRRLYIQLDYGNEMARRVQLKVDDWETMAQRLGLD